MNDTPHLPTLFLVGACAVFTGFMENESKVVLFGISMWIMVPACWIAKKIATWSIKKLRL